MWEVRNGKIKYFEFEPANVMLGNVLQAGSWNGGLVQDHEGSSSSTANMAGVFHLRSPQGKYKMNLSEADAACRAEDATLATYKQLGDAQQVSQHLHLNNQSPVQLPGLPHRGYSLEPAEHWPAGLNLINKPIMNDQINVQI